MDLHHSNPSNLCRDLVDHRPALTHKVVLQGEMTSLFKVLRLTRIPGLTRGHGDHRPMNVKRTGMNCRRDLTREIITNDILMI